MISAFGVEHGISKAAWKAFYPVPPRAGGAIRKIPRSKLGLTSESQKTPGSVYSSASYKGRHIGGMSTTGQQQKVIDSVGVEPGFRRRGVASNLMREAGRAQGAKIQHSNIRSELGDKFARGEAGKVKRGPKPIKVENKLSDKTVTYRGATTRAPHGTAWKEGYFPKEGRSVPAGPTGAQRTRAPISPSRKKS